MEASMVDFAGRFAEMVCQSIRRQDLLRNHLQNNTDHQ